MTGFVSTPPAPGPAVVANDGWWPDLDAARAREAVKLETTVSAERLNDALVAAIITVNREFAAWRAALLPAPASLELVPAPEIAGESERVFLYRRAVYATAKADLDEGYRGTDTAGAGQARADALTPVIADFRRQARDAVRDFLGRPRVIAELI